MEKELGLRQGWWGDAMVFTPTPTSETTQFKNNNAIQGINHIL
jgi:hypothetical protein